MPTKEDWEQLLRYLIKSDELSEIDTLAAPLMRDGSSWSVSGFIEVRGNNQSGFTAIPAGYRLEYGFGWEGVYTSFWSSTDDIDTELPYTLSVQGPYATLQHLSRKLSGFSIRLVKSESK